MWCAAFRFIWGAAHEEAKVEGLSSPLVDPRLEPQTHSHVPNPARKTPAASPVDTSSGSAVPSWFHWVVFAVDAVMLCVAILLAALGRAHFPGMDFSEDVTDTLVYSVRLTAVQMLLAWLTANALFGAYAKQNMGSGTPELSRLLRATLVTAGAIGIGCYLAQLPLSRGFFVLLFAFGLPLLLLGRLAVRRAVKTMHARGRWTTRVLVAGTGATIDDIAWVLGREPTLGYTVVGAIAPDGSTLAETPAGHHVVGHTGDLVDLVVQHGANAVIFAAGAFPSAIDYRRVAWDLADHEVEMIVVPALTEVAGERIRVQPLAGIPFVFIDPPVQSALDRVLKRIFDLIGVLIALVLSAPIMLVATWRVKRFDGGPVFFSQTRIGRSGEPFQCLKFRSMITNADEVLDEIRHLNEGAGLLFKMGEDPRVTKPGVWLRRYSIDELPQLINVLRGDMSLVGPRPPLAAEVALYQGDVRRRLSVQPGITGLWQVSGRSTLSWEDAVRLDLYYVDNWSLVRDIVILLRTVKAVVTGHGAY